MDLLTEKKKKLKKMIFQLIKKFLKYQGQTTENPLGLEVIKARGSYIYTKDKKYLDFVAGVSVNNLGHSNPIINNAII